MTNHPFHLHGKRVLVTGASSGIGRAAALACAQAGASLVLTGRDRVRLEATLAELAPPVMPGTHAGHQAVPADLTDAAQLAALAEQAGMLDGVVHAAGITGFAPVRMLQRSLLDSVMGANFAAPVMLTQRLLFKKTLRDGASIVFLSSIAAHTGTVGVGAYSASKAALEGFLRNLALEVAPRGMRANAVAPAMVETPLVNTDPAFLAEKTKHYPFGIGQPEDVAYAVIYLLADASRKVTGISLDLDGGLAWT
ncbi:SDR family NAD(P)-dependent oxidoreductase [Massilia sp.]|uniref:SDR family NAD(P)-dependent oxidoreductase n=1 Tax=Massilia sp. TaxID=1882437 RepID=UPI0039191041